MSYNNQRHKNSPPSGGLNTSPSLCFITIKVACFAREDPSQEPMSLEISPLSILIASTTVKENTKESIENSYATAMTNIIDSLAIDYTILAITQR